MIRSSIGIVCALVFITTCAQSTAAQALGEHSLSALRGRSLQSQLSHWTELADEGVSAKLLSSDAYHDKFRFRAAPVKQSRNWKMPIVDVRPAKVISIAASQPNSAPTSAMASQASRVDNRVPVLNWVWESSSDLAVRYCELDAPLDRVSLDFIPRPLPAPVEQSNAEVKVLKLKLVKGKHIKRKPSKQNRAMTTGRKDYWDYYGDCDRWGVVFAVPQNLPPSRMEEKQQLASTVNLDRPQSKVEHGLRDLATLVVDRLESAIQFCRSVSEQFVISRS